MTEIASLGIVKKTKYDVINVFSSRTLLSLRLDEGNNICPRKTSALHEGGAF